tara:strand:+ start:251 stop:751 length:501 start_codon:yes stop_codon:yes gene_type:complete
MPSRKKKSEAWKKLCSAAKKGPRRVKMPHPRRKKGYDPLADAAMHKKVQLTLEMDFMPQNLVVIIFEKAFRNLNMLQGKSYDMPRDKLLRCGKALRKLFESVSSYDFYRKKFCEKTLNNVVGRCFVYYGQKIDNADANIKILPTLKEQESRRLTKERVARLFAKIA